MPCISSQMEEAQRERDKMDELRRQAVSQATSISA
jgi:hypothetical protein